MKPQSYIQPRIDLVSKRRLVLAEVYSLLMRLTVDLENSTVSALVTTENEQIENSVNSLTDQIEDKDCEIVELT